MLDLEIKNRKKINIQWWVLSIGTLLLFGKFAAYLLTSSNAILTDALESIINVAAGGFALYSLYLSAKPKDENHPYGHGKIEFISAGIEGSMILMAGLFISGQSVYSFFFPQEINNLDIGIAITGVAGAVNFIMGFMLEREGGKQNSPTMIASGKHLKTDAYSSAALIGGLFIIFLTGAFWLDNLLALGFGILIIITGVKVLRKSVAGIMDEADYELLEKIVEIIDKERRPNWIDIHNLRVIKYGPLLHIDCHLTLPWYLNLIESHHEVEKLDELINKNFETSVEFFVHTDPCLPEACPYCMVQDCKVRKAPFQEKIKWTMENVMKNKKHFL